MRTALLVAEQVQDDEFFYPFYRMQEFGSELDVILAPYKNNFSPKTKLGVSIKYNIVSQDILKNDNLYDLVIIPGGFAAEIMRMDRNILNFVAKHLEYNKIIGAVCHGPQVLLSVFCHNPNLLNRYKKEGVNNNLLITAFQGIWDDITNIGLCYSISSVVKDRNIITAQHYKDLPPFMKTILNEF